MFGHANATAPRRARLCGGRKFTSYIPQFRKSNLRVCGEPLPVGAVTRSSRVCLAARCAALSSVHTAIGDRTARNRNSGRAFEECVRTAASSAGLLRSHMFLELLWVWGKDGPEAARKAFIQSAPGTRATAADQMAFERRPRLGQKEEGPQYICWGASSLERSESRKILFGLTCPLKSTVGAGITIVAACGELVRQSRAL